MVFAMGRHVTRAQAEGVPYELPDDDRSRAFAEQVHSLRREPGILLEVLHLAQESFGCLSKPVLGWIAQELRIPKSQVYATAAFYSLFSLKPEAKYVIRACNCLSCYLQGGEMVLAAIRDAAGIPDGETLSEDGLFSLHTVSCLGLCDQSPVMMINQERYGFLTPERARTIISGIRMKEHVEEASYD